MLKKEIVVTNPEGIHARPASLLVRLAGKFDSEFFIHMHGYKINGKSILGVLTLAAECGATLELETDGSDEEEAMNAIIELIKKDFKVEDD